MTTYENLKLFCRVEVISTGAIGRVVTISADEVEGVEIEFLGEVSSFYAPDEIDITDDNATLTYEFPVDDDLVDWKVMYDTLRAEIARLRGLITTGVDHIKSECKANLIGYSGVYLDNLPKDLQGYSRIFVMIDELNQMTFPNPQI